MDIDPRTLDAASMYKLLIGSVLPRPIGWTSTLSKEGIANLAPFSFFSVASRMPPMLSIGMQPRSDLVSHKDTLVNIRETGEFVVNVVSLAQVNEMHKSAVEHPPEVDEFEAVGLAKAESRLVRAPRVANAPVSMECKLEHIMPMGEVGDHLVIGRIVHFHIRDDVWVGESGRIDTALLQPIGRLAAEYCVADSLFACPVPAELVQELASKPPVRIDQRQVGWSPIEEKTWSASGNVKL